MPRQVGDIVRVSEGAARGQIGRICVVGAMAYTVRIWLNADDHSEGSVSVPVPLTAVEPAQGDAPQC